jgi:AraC family transcriptional regulator
VKSILGYGEFCGQPKKKNCVPGLVLEETVYPARFDTARHSHEHAYFCYVLRGSYTEFYDRKMRECPASSVYFHPPAESHAERMGDADVHSFNVCLELSFLKHIEEYTNVFECQVSTQNRIPVMLAIRLYNEFKDMDAVSPLSIESLVLELIAAVTRCTTRVIRRKPDIWLKRAQELIHSRFAESLSLTEIATEVGVHPVHLGREFRRHFRCTIGQYMRQLRVEYVCRALNDKDTAVSKIALDAGFCDQSHLCRVFRTLTGMTPDGYRSALPSFSRPMVSRTPSKSAH